MRRERPLFLGEIEKIHDCSPCSWTATGLSSRSAPLELALFPVPEPARRRGAVASGSAPRARICQVASTSSSSKSARYAAMRQGRRDQAESRPKSRCAATTKIQ